MNISWETLFATISGFVIAFFAEPIKNWFQRNAERRRLRKMLYQEFLDNYVLFQSRANNLSIEDLVSIIKFRVQIEGYEFTKTNNIVLFYELPEASCLNQLYSICKQLKDYERDIVKEDVEKLMDTYFNLANNYLETGAFNSKIIDEIYKKRETKTIYK